MLRTFAVFFLVFVFSQPAISSVSIPKEIQPLIPSEVDLTHEEYQDARNELIELVTNCGPGVVKGAHDKSGRSLRNSCHFQISLDDLFFRPLKDKTGLILDKNWAYRNGVSFYKARDTEVADNFDIREFMKNGMPELRKQMCGDCWAWATHHGLELSRAVHDQKVYDHSIQSVLSCSRKGSCSGGYMSAVDFLAHGLPYEVDFPYAASDKKCKYTSSEITEGWEGKVQGTPYIGESMQYSLANRLADGSYREGAKVQEMMKAMTQWNSPLVVTVSAYSISGSGVYDSCSAINSGGNHMVTIVGWDMWEGKRVAHVWNSWGHSHGEKGVSRIVWECGNGKLNRGLGVSAKIVQYKAPCTAPDAGQTYLHEILSGKSTEIGASQPANTHCKWEPSEGLENPTACVTKASPKQTTEYHLTASNDCGTSSSMTLVHVWGGKSQPNIVVTPLGAVLVQKD